MNVEYLTVGDESVVETEEFKGISVTSEKWLPMYQVKKEDLKDYLEYQRGLGFTVYSFSLNDDGEGESLEKVEFP